MRYRIDVEDMPEEIEAISREEALKIAHENITIVDEQCSCGGCEECVQGIENFNEVNGLNN